MGYCLNFLKGGYIGFRGVYMYIYIYVGLRVLVQSLNSLRGLYRV